MYVSSNSRELIDALMKVIGKLEAEADVTIPRIAITSKNSSGEQANNLSRISRRKYSSIRWFSPPPSLGTGIDITFPEGAAEIDAVFGFYESRLTNHFELDQQLARVRNPKEINVWINPARFFFETEFEVVVDDLLQTDLYRGTRYGLQREDRQSIADSDPLLTMAALLTIKNRASLNNLKGNFIAHKETQGWEG